MSISNKLVNPTPFEVKIPYEKGVVIKVPADGYVNLTVQQMDDYRPDKPGSEETRRILYEQGVFLEDPEVDYNKQALIAIRQAIKAKLSRYEEAQERLVEMHMTADKPVDIESDQFKTRMRRMGLTQLIEQAEKLKVRETIYAKTVGEVEEGMQVSTPVYDPERTTYATDPPREFPSKLALEIFLSENPDIAAKHNALANAEASVDEDSKLEF